MSKKYFLIFSFFFLAGCEVQESKNIYKPPQELEEFKNIFELVTYSNDQIEEIKIKLQVFLMLIVVMNDESIFKYKINFDRS